MLVYLPTVACAFALAALVYRYDLYEKEPWYMLVLASVLGMCGCWAVGNVEDFALLRLPAGGTTAVQAGVAGVFEELLKLTVVLLIAWLVPQHFNDPFDGLIYGAFAGLGFAVAESFFYLGLQSHASWWMTTGQEMIRLLLHLLLGALTCCGLGLARFRVRRWPWMFAGWVAASMTVHFLWDYACGLPSESEMGAARQRGIAVVLMLTVTMLFGVMVIQSARRSGDIHAPHQPKKRLWGWPFSLLFRRRR